MRLLLSGDLHIGRSSSGVPGIRRDSLRAVAVWERLVQLAISESVELICLSGDVADKENKFWEAVGPVEAGVRRLSEAGIMTVAVSGNHDHDVLARLANQLPADHFRLLGRGGRWERFTVERDGRSILHIDGWSFPAERHMSSPLSDYSLPDDPYTPILGLVHGDLDAGSSRYAPLERLRLRSLPPQGWLLGHIHAARLIAEPGDPWILYPGSPQALDFGEPGVHGPWIAEVNEGLCWPVQRPLSTVRYSDVEVDLSGVEDEPRAEAAVLRQVRAAAHVMMEESGSTLKYLSLRLRLTGRTRISDRIRGITDSLVQDLALTLDNAQVFVESVQAATIPDVDIADYARSNSAPGAVARLILALDQPELPPDVAELLSRTKRELQQTEDHKHFATLDRREISDDLARGYLRDASRALLTELVAQSP